MKIIKAIFVNDVVTPSEPIPENAIAVECNGHEYKVYEEGDDRPSYDE